MFAALATRRLGWQVAALLAAGALIGGCLGFWGSTTDGTADANAATEASASANNAPVANAGQTQTVATGKLVVLDGTGSRDADGDQLVYVWRQVAGQPNVTLEDAFSSRPRFYAPSDITQKTILRFRLTVVDGLAVDFDEVTVTIEP